VCVAATLPSFLPLPNHTTHLQNSDAQASAFAQAVAQGTSVAKAVSQAFVQAFQTVSCQASSLLLPLFINSCGVPTRLRAQTQTFADLMQPFLLRVFASACRPHSGASVIHLSETRVCAPMQHGADVCLPAISPSSPSPFTHNRSPLM
jgi:hypothetical protein